MKYICKECEPVEPCILDTGEEPCCLAPGKCVIDGEGCNWQDAEACALAEAASNREVTE